VTAFSQALTAALLHFIWQGTAVALLLSVAFALLRNRSANARYLIACAAMALMAAMPAVTLCMPYRAPVALPGAIVLAIPAGGSAAAALSPDWMVLLASSARQWTLPLWIVGVVILAIRLLLAWRHVTRLRRSAEDAAEALAKTAAQLAERMKITRPVRVLMTALAESPSVVGWLRPVILIPTAALAGLDAAQLEAILAHELAHIRRHDYLVNILQTVVETLLFYHPAVWWVSSRMRHERELCCDDLAVRYSGDALAYARALTRLERVRVIPGPAVAANAGSLLYRIQRLTGAVRGGAPSRVPALLAAIAAALLIPVTLHRVHAQTPVSPGRVQLVQAPAPLSAAPEVQDSQPGTVSIRTTAGLVLVASPVSDATGTVLVEATLDGRGIVADARVVTGPMELRNQALRIVLERRFENATTGEVRQLNVDFASGRLPRIRSLGQTSSGEPGDEVTEIPGILTELKTPAAELQQLQREQSGVNDETGRLLALEVEAQAQQLAMNQKAEELNRSAANQAGADPRMQVFNPDAGKEKTASALLLSLQQLLELMSKTYGQNSPQIKALKAQIKVAEATVATLESTKGTYWQVLASKDPSSVSAMVRNLTDLGLPVSTSPGPNEVTRVLVSPYSDNATLANVKTQLEKAGLNPIKHVQ
jgi:beta-lactamase regulating signal transducer with metallopeptidase domain